MNRAPFDFLTFSINRGSRRISNRTDNEFE